MGLAGVWKGALDYVQFDDLETSEHTKCKPLSVALAVDPKTRKILNFKVNQMLLQGSACKNSSPEIWLRKTNERWVGIR